MLQCTVCGEDYEPSKYVARPKYCSIECQRKALYERSLKTGKRTVSKRQEYIRHSEAYKQRARTYANKKRFGGNYYTILERDGYKCTQCGSDKLLEVHHKDGSGRGKRESNSDLDNLITLCAICHGVETNKQMGRYTEINLEEVITQMPNSKSINEIAKNFGINSCVLAKRLRKSDIKFTHQKVCEMCSKEFEVSSQYHYKKYCSGQCHHKAGNIVLQKQKEEQREVVFRYCLECSTRFEVNKFNPNQKFCNYDCGTRYRTKHKP